MISLDTETHLFSAGNMAPRLVCVSSASERAVSLWHRVDPWQGEVCDALRRGVVGHNVAYDAAVMMSCDPGMVAPLLDAYTADHVTDTMIRQKLADIAWGRMRLGGKWLVKGELGGKVVRVQGEAWTEVSYSLAACAKRMLGKDLEKGSVRLEYVHLTDTPITEWPQAAVEYALDDARTTLDLFHAQTSSPDEFRQARAALWIHLMSVWGLLTDQPAVRRLEEQIRAEHQAIGQRLLARGLLRIEKGAMVRNMKEAQERLAGAYAARGVDYPKTDGGAPALHREACENSGDPDLVDYASYSSLNTELSKDIEALRRPLIHSRFETLVDTGRTSSSNPNVQNLPRRPGVRECFMPRPGHVFICADFSGLELATLAQVCITLLGHSALGDALNARLDPHLMIAEEILQTPYATLVEWRRGGKCNMGRGCACDVCRVDNARQTGKVANFGLPGGLGVTTLVHYAKQSYGVDLTEGEARDLKTAWFRRWPEMRAYLDLVGRRTVETRGRIEQIFSERMRGNVGFCDGCNTMFQGLGADVAKAAGWALMCEEYDARFGSVLYGSRTVNFPHDEFVVEVPEARASAAAERIRTVMVEAARPWLPDVRIDVEVSAMRRYSKKAVGENKVALV